MKIGIFLPNATFDLPGSPEVGGIETFSFTIGEALMKMGHEVVLFGGEPKENRTHRPTTLTLALHPYWETKSIPDIGTRFQRLIQRVHFAWSSRRSWAQHRCDVVLLAKPFDWPVAWWWKKKRPELKVIMGFHGTDYFAGDRTFYSSVDAAFAVSKTVADLAGEHVGKRPALIPNPVDVDFFSPSSAPDRPGNSVWQIVSSGRLVGWKGFANLIQSVARLRDEHGIIAHLTIAGEGPERANLAASIAKLNLTSQVNLPGRLAPAELRDLLHSADLYVQPSIGMEAFSISALEGACVGLPLLLSDQVGLAGFLTELDYRSYSARKVVDLAIALKNLYHGRNEFNSQDRTGRHDRMRLLFSPDRVAQKILELIT